MLDPEARGWLAEDVRGKEAPLHTVSFGQKILHQKIFDRVSAPTKLYCLIALA